MDTQPRYDAYAFIHKGLRQTLCDCLQSLGCVDTLDNDEFDCVAEKVHLLLDICDTHVYDENHFIHPAMEARAPGSSLDINRQHEGHSQHIQSLREELSRIQQLPTLRRRQALHAFYRKFALFVADNFIHMEQEERDHNATLWSCYSDAEIIAIEQNLVANIDPGVLTVIQNLMISAMNPAERGEFVAMIRNHMPEEAFDGMMRELAPLISPRHYQKLLQALSLNTTELAEAI